MSDKDILMDVLETEKTMTNNMSYALNEASNEDYYNEIFNMFTSINESAKDLFNLGFSLNYYPLEYLTKEKIKDAKDLLSKQLNKTSKA